MIRIPLDDLRDRRLEQALLRATDRKIRDRLQVVRMGPSGAGPTGTSPPTWASPLAPSSVGSTPTSGAAWRP